MKRLLSILVLAAAALGMVACSPDGGGGSAAPGATEPMVSTDPLASEMPTEPAMSEEASVTP